MTRHDELTDLLRNRRRPDDTEIADLLDKYRAVIKRLLAERKTHAGPKPRGPKPALYTVGSDSKSLREWAEALGVPLPRLRYLTRNDPAKVLSDFVNAKRNPASGR